MILTFYDFFYLLFFYCNYKLYVYYHKRNIIEIINTVLSRFISIPSLKLFKNQIFCIFRHIILTIKYIYYILRVLLKF